MTLLAGFLDVFFRALIFVGLALCVGGIIFNQWVLWPAAAGPELRQAGSRRLAMIAVGGALAVSLFEFLTLLITPWALADGNGRWPLAAFLSTGFAQAGIVRCVAALAVAAAAAWVWLRPLSPWTRAVATLSALALMVSGAPLTHGASRLHHARLLMTLTVIHQMAAVVWVGGTVHLISQWRLMRRRDAAAAVWARITARFSPLAFGSVVGMVIAGAGLYWPYFRGFGGLVGTAYGTMLLTKIALMGGMLLLGGLNFLAIRQWKLSGESGRLLRRIPVFIETEAGIGIAVLMAAAAFTGQPPAADVLSERASPLEMFGVFAPKWPQLRLAPIDEMQKTSAPALDQFALPTELDRMQSDFNHNIAGIFVILAGVGAMLNRLTGARWARHWPLILIPFAAFILIFAEPTIWPLGHEDFWATMAAPDVLQHRLAVLLVAGLGVFEWRVQIGGLGHTRWRYAFPLLCGLGGAMLLSHSHTVFAVKWAFLIEVSHNVIGVLAVFMGAGIWLEHRSAGREQKIAAIVWPICFTLVGLTLLFYRETGP